MRKLLLFIFSFVSLFFFTSPVLAHDMSLMHSSISIVGQKITVAITLPYTNVLSLSPEKEKSIEETDLKFFAKPFEKGFTVTNNHERCTPKLTNIQSIPDSKVITYQFEFACKRELDKLHFSYDLFFNISKIHKNIADFYVEEFGKQIIFSQELRTYDLPVKEIRGKRNTSQLLFNVTNFLTMGVNHIFTGYDHILFLLGLLLLINNLRSLFKVITSFTIAHSVTLILSALSIIILPARLTESLIALSIVYIAFENLSIVNSNFFNKKYIWLVAFVFGLMHGFGFSSVLREIGLPQNGLIPSLLSFNVGVEIGQIIIISLLFPILWYIRKKKIDKEVTRVTALIIGLLGIIWFIQRAFF